MKKILALILSVVLVATTMPMVMAVKIKRTAETEAFLDAFCKFYLSIGDFFYDNNGNIDIGENIEELSCVFEKILSDSKFEWLGPEPYNINSIMYENRYNLAEYTQILLDGCNEFDDYLKSSGYTKLFDSYRVALEYNKINLYTGDGLSLDELEHLEAIMPKEGIRAAMQKYDADLYLLGEKYLEDPTSVSQAEWDKVVSEFVEYMEKVNSCMIDDVHFPGDGIDRGDGTHIADCTYCKATDFIVTHTFGEYVSNGDATTQADGTKTAKCEHCDATDTIPDIGSKLDHKYTAEITTVATHLVEGVKTFTCTCGDSYTEIIPKTPDHTYYASKITSPTCEEAGYTTYTCACGDSYNDNFVAEKGHNYENQMCTSCGKKCSCNCHKTGFMGFVWKITRFFNKLFKTNRQCVCGVAHY